MVPALAALEPVAVRAVRVLALRLRAAHQLPHQQGNSLPARRDGWTSRRVFFKPMSSRDFEYVGFWPRVGASIIDTILVLLVTAPLIYWIYGADQAAGLDVDVNDLLAAVLASDLPRLHLYLQSLMTELTTPRGPLDVLINWVLPAVVIIVFWLARNATPGKMAVGACVVDAKSREPISVGQAIVRYLGYYVSVFPLCLGLLWVAFDPRKQGFHDKLARTVVVRWKTRGPRGSASDGE